MSALTVAEVLDGAGWRYDVLPAEQRSAMHIVAVIGSQFHSDMRWHRIAVGTAATRFEGRQGYYSYDIAQIEERGGMDPGTGIVVAWMDFMTPPLPLEKQGEECALPMPALAREQQA